MLNLSSNMQNVIQIGQVQPSVLPQAGAAVKSMKEELSTQLSTRLSAARAWWEGRSETFTRLCATNEGEAFTHGEVVLAHAGAVLFLVILGVAGWLEGGAV